MQKQKISRIYYQTKDTIFKIINILKFLDKRHLYKLFFLIISMIIGAIIELLFLVSLSSFIKIILNNGLLTEEIISDNGFNYYFFNIINFFAKYTESYIIANSIIFIFMALITLSVRLLTLRINVVETAKIGSFIETKCGESLMRLPYNQYKDFNISKLLTDFNNIPKFVSSFFQSGIQSLSSLIIIVFLTIYIKLRSDSLFIFAFFALAFIYIITLLINIKKLKSLSKKNKKLLNQRTSNINFIIRMFRNILLAQNESKTTRNYSSIVSSIYSYNAQGLLISGTPKIVIEYSAIIAVSILLIIQSIIYGPAQSIETTGIFLIALLRILPSLQIIYVFLAKIIKSRFVIESVYDLLNLPKIKNINYSNKNLTNSSENINSIQLKNISFKYSAQDPNIIKNFSYEFQAGKSYALVGTSGSGKSTLIDIILYLLVPQRGEITLNKKLELSNENNFENIALLRSNTLLIGQNDFYCGSRIKDILEITLEDEKDEYFLKKLKEGINYLKINEIFEKNFIYSFIGENGSKISGGQRQRILLLKAFLSRKSILIFDEALSSLDEVTKNFIIEFLFSSKFFTNKRIMIFSTHSNKVANACHEIIRI